MAKHHPLTLMTDELVKNHFEHGMLFDDTSFYRTKGGYALDVLYKGKTLFTHEGTDPQEMEDDMNKMIEAAVQCLILLRNQEDQTPILN